jgi:DNA-binding response OmpR family regulator
MLDGKLMLGARLAMLLSWVLLTAVPAFAAPPAMDLSQDHAGVSLLIAMAVAVFLVGVLIQKRRARLVGNSPLNGTLPDGLPIMKQRGNVAEEEDYSKYLAELRARPAAGTGAAKPAGENTAPSGNALKDFHTWAPGQVSTLQKLMSTFQKAKTPMDQHEKLVEACDKVAELKNRAGLPELRPAWQLAITLEGLLKQLSRRVNTVTPSNLRTIGSALGLMTDLCAPGVRADLESNPPIRLLVVDDDPVSGSALSAAARKALDKPDQAQDGESALVLVNKERYDLITLDVMMPNMDGFELCEKIRETALNRLTPVLFVTSLSDFESRTRLLAVGGNEVMVKPFMAFEITVKALTLVLRARLRHGTQVFTKIERSASHCGPAVDWPSLAAAPATASTAPGAPIELPVQTVTGAAGSGQTPTALLPPAVFETPDCNGDGVAARKIIGPRRISQKFLTYMTICVSELKQRVTAFNTVDDAETRQEMAARLHMRLHGLSRSLDVKELRPAFELSRALEGLFKKVADTPRIFGETSVETAISGLDLLNELCAPEVKSDLATKPAMKILVVDDEPMARRALTGALQLAFPRPESVESGDAALELAGEGEFDLVFTDVCMPGTDGFALCPKLHQNPFNRLTPVVFVTNHSDDEFRAKAKDCGATDYVVKPFIFAEITLKALTIALRGRLVKAKKAAAQTQANAASDAVAEDPATASVSD